MGGSIPKELFEQASAPVLERIRADQGRLEEPLRGFLVFLEEHLFSKALRIESGMAAAGVKGNSRRGGFRQAFHLSPKAYLEECRMEVVFRLLQADQELTAARVSEAVGFGEKAFSIAFKRHFRTTFTQLRRRLRENRVLRHCDPQLLRAAILSGAGEGVITEATEEALLEVLESRGAARWEATEPAATGDTAEVETELYRQVLRELSPKEIEAALRSGLRFQTIMLFRRLVEKTRLASREDPQKGVELAHLAVDSLWGLRHRMNPIAFSSLRVEGYVVLANAQRLADQLGAADLTFQMAERQLAEFPVRESLIAELYSAKGALRRFQGQYEQAETLFDQALATRPCSLELQAKT